MEQYESATEDAEDARRALGQHSALSTQLLSTSVLRTEFALYLRFIGARIRSQMQYKVSFVLDVVSRFLVNGLELAAIFILFNRFSSLGGWSVGEVAFLYGLVTVSFALP